MFRIRPPYLLWALLLLLIEIAIALFVTDGFIRPYVGDYLVVMLVYCGLRAVFRIGIPTALIATLLFAYFVECLQYLDILAALGLRGSTLANIVLGNLFEWIDMLAYTLGVLTLWLLEIKRLKTSSD